MFLFGEKIQGLEPQMKPTPKLGVKCKAQNQQGNTWKPALAKALSLLGKPLNHPGLICVAVKQESSIKRMLSSFPANSNMSLNSKNYECKKINLTID